MKYRVLITGGAGFIGSHLADALLARGYSVRALDNLAPHIHGPGQNRPEYLAPDVDLCVGDLRDPRAVARALEGVDVVFHLAALVGVSQSMYKVHDYMDVNTRGTAVLLESLARRPVRKLIVGSSMSVYGEGLYRDEEGREVSVVRRSTSQLRRNEWELRDQLGRAMTPSATPETKVPALESIYALSKHAQEQQCLIAGRAYDIPTTILRLFSVYGPRQTLSNPHGGALSIFASRFLSGRAPLIYEDGLQKRDYVSVHDVVEACVLTLTEPRSDGRVLNVGSGEATSVIDVATKLAVALGRTPAADVSGKYRAGDVRHCFADITLAKEVLGYQPRVGLDEGIQQLAESLQRARTEEGVPQADADLQFGGIS